MDKFIKEVDKPMWEKLVRGEMGFSRNEMLFLLPRLSRTGLLTDLTGIYLDTATSDAVHMITPTFRKMMDFLDESDIS